MKDDFDPHAHVRHMARAMGLDIRSDWLANVVANMEATHGAAVFVGSFALDTHEEPAPVFVP
jgi:hypothetical protein